MVGHYLAEFSITYKPSKHGRAGMVDKKVRGSPTERGPTVRPV